MSDTPKALPADKPADSLEFGLRAAFGSAAAPQSSVLRILQARTDAKLGVQLPDAQGESASTTKTSPDSTSLRDTAGRYQVMGEIGRGGVGVVFKGHDVDLGRDVALKVLREEYAQHPEVLARFVEEAQIGGQLQHPGIVPVYEIGLQNGERPFFAMKLVKGETLAEQLGRRKDPSADRRRFLGIFEQVCQTIAFAHARRVVHRDLKPGNIMIGAFGEVQVVDWGFAKVLPKPGEYGEQPAKLAPEASQVSVISTVRSQPSASSHSVVGSTMGTPAYMPPEQAHGDVAHMDERSDVFGLGAILCEILTGRAVYLLEDGDLIQQAGLCDMTQAHARIEHSGADASLIALCKQCLSPSRLARPASASEVAAQVGAYLTSVEERARAAQIHAAEAKVKARSTMLLAAAALVIVVLGGGGYAWVQHAAASRREQATQRVAEAMNEASGLVGQARAAGQQDLALWDRAVSASEQAQSLAKNEDASDEQRLRAAAQLTSARDERATARQAAALSARNATMLERLIEVRIPPDDAERTARRTTREARRLDAAYADLFREYLGGQDLLKLDLDAAASALEEGDIEVGLAAGLDHWAITRKNLAQEADAPSEAATRALQQLAQRIDHEDLWRSDLRARLAEPVRDRNALEALAKSADFQALPATSVVLLGNALRNAGATDSAIAVYRHGRTTFPADVGLNLGLAQAYDSLGEPGLEDAVTCYRIVVALRPKMVLARFWLGYDLKLQGHLDEAIASYRHAIELDPKFAGAHNNLGGVLDDQGRLDEALASYRHAIELDPKFAMAHYNLGGALRLQGHLDEALTSVRKALELDPKVAAAHFALGNVLKDQGHLDDAIASYRKAIELDPKYAPAHDNLGDALGLQGHLDEALTSVRKGLEFDPTVAEGHSILGRILSDQGHLDEAIASYRHAIELDPKLAVAHNNLSVLLRNQGHLDEALASARKAIEFDPKVAVGHIALGNVLRDQGHLDEAIASYRHAIDFDPKLAVAHHNLGIALRKQGSLDEAIASFRKAIELDPKEAMAHNNLGLAMQAQGQLDEAITSFRQAIELDPKSAMAHANLGAALKDQGHLEEAIASCRKAIELDPRVAAPHINVGGALTNQGHLDEAIASLRHAIELDPKDAMAHANLGVALGHQGNIDEAIASFRKAIELDPKLALAHSNLGAALKDQGHLEEALASCREAIELDPTRASFHTNLGAALAIQGHLDEAVASFRKAIELNPNEPNAQQNLGTALQEQGSLDEAIASFRKAVAQGPNLAAGHNKLAWALRAQGHMDEAIASYRTAIELDPKDARSHNNLGLVLKHQGNLDEAITSYRKALELDPNFGAAHYNLGWALHRQLHDDEALSEYRLARAIFASGHDAFAITWAKESQIQIDSIEKLIARQPAFLAIIRGERDATSAEEWNEAAVFAAASRGHLAGLRIYERAFAAQPELLERDLPRYNAACYAAMAGSGQGAEADRLSDVERAALRGRALTWLRALAVARNGELEGTNPTREEAVKKLKWSQADADLACVRDEAALQRLPAEEAESWRVLWREIAELVMKGGEKK